MSIRKALGRVGIVLSVAAMVVCGGGGGNSDEWSAEAKAAEAPRVIASFESAFLAAAVEWVGTPSNIGLNDLIFSLPDDSNFWQYDVMPGGRITATSKVSLKKVEAGARMESAYDANADCFKHTIDPKLAKLVKNFLKNGCGSAAGTSTAAPTSEPKTAAVNSDAGVKIGSLTWTKQNLNIETPNSWCYENDKSNCAKYGRLYTHEAAKKACQSMGGKWRLPTSGDWHDLMMAVGGVVDDEKGFYYRNDAGKKLKSKSGWGNDNGPDNYGFSALPGGQRDYDGNSFYRVGNCGYWWDRDGAGDGDGCYYGICGDDVDVCNGPPFDSYGFSVRCVTGELEATTETPPSGAFSAEAAITKEEWAILMQDPGFKAADQKLGDAYKRASAAAAQKSDDLKQALLKEQRTWSAKRERDAFAQASKGSLEYKRFFIDKAYERIAELQAYTDGR